MRGELGPGVGGVVEHDAAEHAVVIEDEGGFGGVEDEVVVALALVVGRGGEELAGHAEVDFEVECVGKGEEHALSVGLGRLEGLGGEDLEGGGGAIAVDASLWVGFDGGNFFSVEGGPLTAGQLDFC